jgi:hypothetical protein
MDETNIEALVVERTPKLKAPNPTIKSEIIRMLNILGP